MGLQGMVHSSCGCCAIVKKGIQLKIRPEIDRQEYNYIIEVLTWEGAGETWVMAPVPKS